MTITPGTLLCSAIRCTFVDAFVNKLWVLPVLEAGMHALVIAIVEDAQGAMVMLSTGQVGYIVLVRHASHVEPINWRVVG